MMSMADAFLAEFDAEAQTTRRFLEQLPEDRLEWRPHEKSMTAGQLALHIATAPGAIVEMAMADVVPFPKMDKAPEQPTSLQQILDAHDASVAKVRDTLPTFSDEQMQRMWKATYEGHDLIEMPRAGVIRTIMLNHWIHHRGQFGVYLRLVGAKVPSSYGPSGDEMPDVMKDLVSAGK
ncbi:MAG: DinB family protein [Pirellulales bacterium]